ncbi:hypothetical protein FD11_GL001901 [Ligilactobacillus pobuzihii E100301 = KCTC 13174]|uniref:NADP-dependent oxidoreductase domain-containing protein n=1 Tax=Ligilactobacillus pobuzihii TaxID=449659 RepID=A0A0R2LGG5_9LACO|nr:hypothetical protein FD11_GL001901 [Ligilactobacillus pobuzihii E100301 = KCTC 13174]KRN98572.1 hypothetical protein IV66_GL001903 [Ligilactobacillus pobuzihii]GEN47629.1 hypothetical protein LPO01_04210 [Ligilactobacillus pobuzihii]
MAWAVRYWGSSIGASRPQQLVDNYNALHNLEFSSRELTQIDRILDDQPQIDWHKK